MLVEVIILNLDRIMREKNITNVVIAEQFHTTPASVSRWRNNVSSPDNAILPALCDFLGCTLDELLRSENPQIPRKVARKRVPRESGMSREAVRL